MGGGVARIPLKYLFSSCMKFRRFCIRFNGESSPNHLHPSIHASVTPMKFNSSHLENHDWKTIPWKDSGPLNPTSPLELLMKETLTKTIQKIVFFLDFLGIHGFLLSWICSTFEAANLTVQLLGGKCRHLHRTSGSHHWSNLGRFGQSLASQEATLAQGARCHRSCFSLWPF